MENYNRERGKPTGERIGSLISGENTKGLESNAANCLRPPR
jgi:hypothetical protein